MDLQKRLIVLESMIQNLKDRLLIKTSALEEFYLKFELNDLKYEKKQIESKLVSHFEGKI